MRWRQSSSERFAVDSASSSDASALLTWASSSRASICASVWPFADVVAFLDVHGEQSAPDICAFTPTVRSGSRMPATVVVRASVPSADGRDLDG